MQSWTVFTHDMHAYCRRQNVKTKRKRMYSICGNMFQISH